MLVSYVKRHTSSEFVARHTLKSLAEIITPIRATMDDFPSTKVLVLSIVRLVVRSQHIEI